MVDEEEITNKQKSSKTSFLKIFSVILLILTWVVLIIIRTQTEISLVYPLIVSILLSVVFVIGIFWSFIYKKFKELRKPEEEKIPEAITEEQADEIAKEILLKFGDHIDKVRNRQTFNVGKNQIYLIQIIPYHNKERSLDSHIILNANFPKIMPTVFYDRKPTIQELTRAINTKSKTPLDEPEKEIRIETDLAEGKRVTYKKTTPTKKKSKDEEKKEEII